MRRLERGASMYVHVLHVTRQEVHLLSFGGLDITNATVIQSVNPNTQQIAAVISRICQQEFVLSVSG